MSNSKKLENPSQQKAANKMTKQEILDVISAMTLEDVQGSNPGQGQGPVSNTIEMTSAMVEEIVIKLSQGKGLRDIRNEVKGSSGESLTWNQIREVMKARREYLASLSEEV